MDQKDVIKAVVNYLVPTLLAALIGLLKPLGSPEFWGSVLRSWRGVAVLAVLLLSLVYYSSGTLWLGLMAVVLVAAERVWQFTRSPKAPTTLLFAGLYGVGADNRLVRVAQVAHAESTLLTTMSSEFASHRIQGFFPIRLRDHRFPALIYTHLTLDGFRKLIAKQARTCLGVIWGVVDASGRLQHFETTVNPDNYHGGADPAKLLSDSSRIISRGGTPTPAAMQLCARLIVAVWGESPCDYLNAQGKWRESLAAAVESTNLMTRALEEYGLQDTGAEADQTVEFVRRRYMPIFLRQQACALYQGEAWSAALEKLLDALLIDPLTPLSPKEFEDFYNHRYAWEILGNHTMPKEYAQFRDWFAQRAMTELSPSLQVYSLWLKKAVSQSVPVDGLVEDHFSKLSGRHADNPFVYIYWGDAIKDAALPPASNGQHRRLPKNALDLAVKQYERARELAPHLRVLAPRLAAMYWLQSGYYSVNSRKARELLRKAGDSGQSTGKWFSETFPMLLNTVLQDEDRRITETLENMAYLFQPDPKNEQRKPR